MGADDIFNGGRRVPIGQKYGNAETNINNTSRSCFVIEREEIMIKDKSIIAQLYDPRKMSARSQIAFISKQLLKNGIDPDTVDLQALIDPTLNYRENYANIMASLAGSAKVGPDIKSIIENPACEKAKELKAELKDAKTACQCNTCSQMGLYDPAPRRPGQRTLSSYRQKQKTLPISRPPKNWFRAMYEGIRKRSDVRNPASIVASIWRRLSPGKRADIRRKEEKGESFRYDLPLPEDHATRGSGTVRVVKPFRLAEVQVNVPRAAYDRILGSGLFQSMKRNDGSTALVKRCKSNSGNCNIFVDRM